MPEPTILAMNWTEGTPTINNVSSGDNVNWTFILPFSGSFVFYKKIGVTKTNATVIFHFQDSAGNTLNGVEVYVQNSTSENMTLFGVFNDGDSTTLAFGTYKFTFVKEGYTNATAQINLDGDMTLYVYFLKPGGSLYLWSKWEGGDDISLPISQLPGLNITPINPYAKALLDSGGSFGDTVKLAIKGDELVKLILPQLMIFAVVIIVFWQTQSPLAALAGALIMQAMWSLVLDEPPNLRNSGVTFALIVFLVAWTLWDLFYNYARET
ncbi:hypothetical protein [Thermococcus sp. 21S7]|uniref:hypothetical protein n=1 Tax=Thermococcus sp. 21S7 TaxID=1638221 RepID=UPI001980B856|nr:hypothetical protein [Thermococcus sp. 21S7]